MNVAQIRKTFPYLSEKVVYFNHASLGPLSVPVLHRINEFLTQRSTGGIDNFSFFMASSSSAKTKLAKMLNCKPDRISWALNVSESISVLANGLKYKTGDRIILFENEFPSNVYPFLNLKKQGVEIDFVKTVNGRILIEDIARVITPRTRMLSISAVQFLSGFRADLKSIGELCRKNNIIFCVDAIQGLGAVTIDIENCNIDFLSGGSQKWLMALQGTSYFYISEELQARIQPNVVGWTSVKNAWNLTTYDLTFKEDASCFQSGTLNAAGITALDETLNLFIGNGINEVEKSVIENTLYLRDKLIDQGVELYLKEPSTDEISGITSFRVENSAALFETLKGNNIVCSMREGYIRLAPHFYNTREEIDFVIDVIKQ